MKNIKEWAERRRIETYEENWEYKWVVSKNRTQVEMEAYNKLSDLQPADWYPKNTLVYIIEENKIYRAKHIKTLKYIGLTEQKGGE